MDDAASHAKSKDGSLAQQRGDAEGGTGRGILPKPASSGWG